MKFVWVQEKSHTISVIYVKVKEFYAEKKKSRDKDNSELADYKKNKARMLRVLRMARDLKDRNVIFTAWANRVYPKIPGTQQANKDAQPTQIAPDVGNAIMNTLLGFCDYVFYLFAHEKVRYLVTDKYSNIDAKCRDSAVAAKLTTLKDGVAVPYLVNPKMKDVYTGIVSAFMLDPKAPVTATATKEPK